MTFPSDITGSKNVVQALGSSISYAKRYIMCAMLNITTRGEDDDGFAAIPDATVSPAQAAELTALLTRCKPETQNGVHNIYGSLETLRKSDFNKVLAQLKKAVQRDEAS